MGDIRLMPDDLASQVAAGEVVERPASVVKELVENSIDASAGKIDVHVRRGGISLIEVIDDGEGMDRQDAMLSVERHATSKLKNREDLLCIRTMGFRGEALASIASVSRFRLTTRQKNALAGTEIVIHGGKLRNVRDSGEPPGTQIEVRSLFYNIPARRKFLRTERTESSHLEQQLRVQAIAKPEIQFQLIANDRVVFRLPPADNLLERITGLIGDSQASQLLAIEPQERNGIRVQGFLGPPGMSRSNRNLQLVYLNGRHVEGAVIQYALREGYHTALMKGQYPVTFLFVEMDPADVDVNVHPAKREVRFHNARQVRDVLIDTISTSLEKALSRGTVPTGFPTRSAPEPDVKHSELPLVPERGQRSLRRDWWEQDRESTRKSNPENERDSEISPPLHESGSEPEQEAAPSSAPAQLPEKNPAISVGPETVAGDEPQLRPDQFRIMGVLDKLYVLMQGPEGLVLMDQHAAHERILFEQMRNRIESAGMPSQQLLVPLTVELDPREFHLMSSHFETLDRMGIGAEAFGANTIKIDRVPAFVKGEAGHAFVSQLLDELARSSRKMSSTRLGEDVIATTVCRQAVKANDVLREPELDRLLEDLLACELPFCCPHGRPTLIQIRYEELERRFGRKV